MIQQISTLLFGVSIGILISKYLNKWTEKLSHKKLVLERNLQFKQILEKVNTKRSRFKNRINNTVYVGVKLNDFGKVDVIVLLDKQDVVIFKNEKCLMTSEFVEKDLINKIIEDIYRVHHHRIEDTVQVLGMTFSRQDFEKSFGISVEELNRKADEMMNAMNGSNSEVKNIINKNKVKLDIDEILDKINQVGIENLTKEELDFLNNYNK